MILDDTSDHFPVFATVNIESQLQTREIKNHYIFDYAKLPDLTDHLEQALVDFENINDPEVACNKLISAYTSGINKFSFFHKPT